MPRRMTRKQKQDIYVARVGFACVFVALALWGIFYVWENYTGWVIAGLVIISTFVLLVILYKVGFFKRLKRKKANSVDMTGKKRVTVPDFIRHQVWARANYQCERPNCGYRGQPEIHHIDENPSNNALFNLAAICPNCHTRIHHGEWSQSTQCSWIMGDP